EKVHLVKACEDPHIAFLIIPQIDRRLIDMDVMPSKNRLSDLFVRRFVSFEDPAFEIVQFSVRQMQGNHVCQCVRHLQHSLPTLNVLVDAPTGKTWLVEGSIRQPILRAQACPPAIALVRPRAVRNNPLLHSPLEELHIDSLSSQPPPSFDRATSTRRTRITLDYNVLVGSKREAWRFGSLIDLPESF